MNLIDTIVGTELEDNAFVRKVEIYKTERDTYTCEAIAVHHKTREKFLRGIACVSNFEDAKAKAKEWTEYKEFYFL